MFKYGRMLKKPHPSQCVVPLALAQTACCLGFKSLLGQDVFCFQVIYVIVKIVIPCFSRPSLLSRSQWDSILELVTYSNYFEALPCPRNHLSFRNHPYPLKIIPIWYHYTINDINSYNYPHGIIFASPGFQILEYQLVIKINTAQTCSIHT